MSLETSWKNNNCEEMDTQSGGFKHGLPDYSSSSGGAFQRWNADPVWMMACGNVIMSYVHAQLHSLDTFSCTGSSGPIALCAKH